MPSVPLKNRSGVATDRQYARVLTGIFLAMACFCVAGEVSGQDTQQDFLEQELRPELVEEYERKLNAILKTRRDEEKEFVAKIVLGIRDGKIPFKLVSTSFQWVKNKRPLTNYPFIYFEKVLRLQAEKLDIAEAIPPFDFSIYKSAGQRTAGQQLDAGQPTDLQRQSLLETARTRVANLFRPNANP